MIDRCPSARGPNSMRPWNSPTTCPSAMSRAMCRAQSAAGQLDVRVTVRLQVLTDLLVAELRTEVCAAHGIRAAVCAHARVPARCATRRAPPRARRRHRRPPAGSRCRRRCPLGAVGHWPRSSAPRRPPCTGVRLPVMLRACRAMREHDLLGHVLDRAREVHVALRDRRFRCSRPVRRTASAKRSLVMRRPSQESK